MDAYDSLYRLYAEFDTETLRAYQEFVDLFPPVDSRVALDQWQDASDELADRKETIEAAFPEVGATFGELAALATRDQAFTALDLYTKYGRGINVLVLDVDETLRSAGNTDNEIPRETLHLLTRFHEEGVPIVVCTGQTLENVKGFLIQGLGSQMVHSGDVSIVYEAGTGVFTPGHGADTKQLLYESLDETIQTIFSDIRSRVVSEAPDELRRGCHLQGNEFNVTLKPNFETGGDDAQHVIEQALLYLLDLLEDCVTTVVGVESAFDVLGIDDPFALVMGDSKSDLRVMQWAAENEAGVAAAPAHSSQDVLAHVGETDDLVFDRGDAAEMLRTAYALHRLAALD